MEFDPGSGLMKCPYCGQTQVIAEARPDVETRHALSDYQGEGLAGHLGQMSEKALEVACSGCGSQVLFEPPEVAGLCAFCGARIVAQPKAADPLIAPDGVLPASVPKANATRAIKDWLGSRWFAPNGLQQMARQEGIQGVYLPYWMFDAESVTRYGGERGEYYYVEERYQTQDAQGRSVIQTRRVRHTRWYPASGEVARSFDDVLINATRAVNKERLRDLTPWDLQELKAYEPAFLSGFKAQRYQIPLEEGFEESRQMMTAVIQGDVRRDIGGDEQRIHQMEPRFFDVAFRHLLLPVWIGAYRFNGKVYQVMVNGRTGEVQGEQPYSAVKIALLVAAILLVVMVVVALRK
jgi:ribosomal protein S27E